MPDADEEASRPDPTKSVSDEIERRKVTGAHEHKTPDVRVESGGPSSPSEVKSDKSWSRNASEVQDREVKREGTAPSGSQPPEG